MRNRIKDHRKVKVRDLVSHELNPRVHGEDQRQALRDLIGEIGFARSVLAYELPDGRLKLIDGHLRKSELEPDDEIDVEVLDVTDSEAKKLLLSIDPLAQLADYDNAALEELRQTTESDSDTLNALWASLKKSDDSTRSSLKKAERDAKKLSIPEQFLVLVECKNEKEQIALLRRFKAEGLSCTAKTS